MLFVFEMFCDLYTVERAQKNPQPMATRIRPCQYSDPDAPDACLLERQIGVPETARLLTTAAPTTFPDALHRVLANWLERHSFDPRFATQLVQMAHAYAVNGNELVDADFLPIAWHAHAKFWYSDQSCRSDFERWQARLPGLKVRRSIFKVAMQQDVFGWDVLVENAHWTAKRTRHVEQDCNRHWIDRDRFLTDARHLYSNVAVWRHLAHWAECVWKQGHTLLRVHAAWLVWLVRQTAVGKREWLALIRHAVLVDPGQRLRQFGTLVGQHDEDVNDIFCRSWVGNADVGEFAHNYDLRNARDRWQQARQTQRNVYVQTLQPWLQRQRAAMHGWLDLFFAYLDV